MNKPAFCLLMTVLIPSISLCTLESTARYRQAVSAQDAARVARPAIQLRAETDPAGLAAFLPGESGIFEFSVTGGDSYGPSEVSQTYWLEITPSGTTGRTLISSLFYMDEQGHPQSMIPDEDGRYAGWQSLGLLPATHLYRLILTLPPESEPPTEPADVSIDVIVTAIQADT